MRLRDIQMHAVIYTPDGNGGPGVPKLELDRDILNCVWQQNQSLPGFAAFSLARFNPKLSSINWMQDHIALVREDGRATKTVFAGKLVKPEMAGTDVIVRCWDYAAFLQRSRTGFRTDYSSKKIGTEIIKPEWDLAQSVSNSPFAFVADGTFEDPLGLDGVTAIRTNADFGVVLFNRLFTFYTLCEMAMANTANNVKFEITREAPFTFNVWKNYGTAKTKYAFSFPGNLVAHDYSPGFDAYRNDIATVISDGAGGDSEYSVQSTDVATSPYRRLQDAVAVRTLLGATGATESDQGKAVIERLLKEGLRTPQLISLQPRQGELTPFDGWDLGDTFRVTLQKPDRSGDEYDGHVRAVSVGAAWTPEAGELLQLFARGTP